MMAADSPERSPRAGPGGEETAGAAAPGGGDEVAAGRADEAIPVRLIMPDRWLEQVEELPLSTTVEEAKVVGLRAMLLRDTDDPADFYTEYAEKRVRDESVTLEELGMQPNEVLSIRAYDLGHYPPFRG